MYYLVVDHIADFLCIILAIYFLICCACKEQRLTSLVICTSSTIAYFTFPEFNYDIDYMQQYTNDIKISIEFDGVTGLILTTLLVRERIAIAQALLLAFAVTCHTMILYDLTVSSSVLTNFFYDFYDELIITVSILQMVVARNGIRTAIKRLSYFFGSMFRLVSRAPSYFIRCTLRYLYRSKDNSVTVERIHNSQRRRGKSEC